MSQGSPDSTRNPCGALVGRTNARHHALSSFSIRQQHTSRRGAPRIPTNKPQSLTKLFSPWRAPTITRRAPASATSWKSAPSTSPPWNTNSSATHTSQHRPTSERSEMPPIASTLPPTSNHRASTFESVALTSSTRIRTAGCRNTSWEGFQVLRRPQ